MPDLSLCLEYEAEHVRASPKTHLIHFRLDISGHKQLPQRIGHPQWPDACLLEKLSPDNLKCLKDKAEHSSPPFFSPSLFYLPTPNTMPSTDGNIQH